MDANQLRDQAIKALERGDIQEARARFRDAVGACDGDGVVLRELAGSLWGLYDFERALEVYRRAAEVEPRNIDSHLLAAQKLFSIGRFRQCAAWLEEALSRNPKDDVVLTMLGEVYDRDHRLQDAERCAREGLALSPQNVRALRLLAHLERRAGQFPQARRRIADHLARFPGAEDWRLRYELAAVLDRLGEYDQAMKELFAAKAQLRSQAQPHLARAHAIRRRQREVLALLSPTDLAGWCERAGPRQRRGAMAFLCGHPRSGTTLVEQILDAHPDIVTTDETGILTREFIEPIVRRSVSAREAVEELRGFRPDQIAEGRETYLRFTEAHLGSAVGDRVLIDKDPSLTPDLALPLRLFPEARVIFPLRDPRDVSLSYFFTLIPLNAGSAAAADLRSSCESCAHSLDSWQRWRELSPDRKLEIRYEQLIAGPETEIRRWVHFLGVPWSERLLRFHERAGTKGVRTPSYADVAQPLYRRAIGRWKNYEKYLAPHLDILRPYVRAFGYE